MAGIVVVGASVAGLRSAEVLRSRGFDGAITVVDADPAMPYDRPPLSKRVLLGLQQPADIALRRPDALAALRLDLRLGWRAVALDVAQRTVTVDDGSGPAELPFEGLILAIGSAARTIPAWRGIDGVVTLRTLADSLHLRDQLQRGPAIAIVGAGFIGLEVASACRELGLGVTVVEPLEAPVVRGLGVEMGLAIARRHRSAGVDLRLSTSVEELVGSGRVEALRLSDGTTVAADVVLVGIGAAPVVDWLEGSGLDVGDGIVCDETLRAAPFVYAAGDAARWPHPLVGESVRIEHWTNAAEQGALAASNLLEELGGGRGTASSEVPFFWSDQLGGRVQYLGRARPSDRVVVGRGDALDGPFVGLYGDGDRLHAAVAWSDPRHLMPLKAVIGRGGSMDEAVALLRD